MKITAIETLVCHARMRNWVFVKVVTDQPGLIGWGEATLEWHTRSIVGAIEDMSHLLIGEDPTRVEYLWQMMYRQHFWHGHGIVRATAIAGIDLALWDIVGKVANMPLSKVFGGPVRDWVRTYCHLGGGRMEDFYQTPADNAKRFAELAQQAVADGYTAFKSMAVPSTMPISRPATPSGSASRAKATTSSKPSSAAASPTKSSSSPPSPPTGARPICRLANFTTSASTKRPLPSSQRGVWSS